MSTDEAAQRLTDRETFVRRYTGLIHVKECGCPYPGAKSHNAAHALFDALQPEVRALLDERDTLHARIEDKVALANVWVVNIVQRIAPTEFSAVFASSEQAQAFIQESRLNDTWERDGWLRVQALKANTADAVVAYLTSASDDEATT